MKLNVTIVYFVSSAVILFVALAIALSFALSPIGNIYIAEKQLTSDGYVLCVKQKGYHFLFGEFTVVNDSVFVDESFYNLFSVGDIVKYDTTYNRIIIFEE